MPKTKGTPGGRLIELKTREEYTRIRDFLLHKFDVYSQRWNHEERKAFKKQARKFEVKDNGNAGEWPNGPVLYVLIKKKGAVTTSESKLYVPEWEKTKVLAQFHGGEGRAGHFGKSRLHALVCVVLVYSILANMMCRSLKGIMVYQSVTVLNSQKTVKHARCVHDTVLYMITNHCCRNGPQ